MGHLSVKRVNDSCPAATVTCVTAHFAHFDKCHHTPSALRTHVYLSLSLQHIWLWSGILLQSFVIDIEIWFRICIFLSVAWPIAQINRAKTKWLVVFYISYCHPTSIPNPPTDIIKIQPECILLGLLMKLRFLTNIHFLGYCA